MSNKIYLHFGAAGLAVGLATALVIHGQGTTREDRLLDDSPAYGRDEQTRR